MLAPNNIVVHHKFDVIENLTYENKEFKFRTGNDRKT